MLQLPAEGRKGPPPPWPFPDKPWTGELARWKTLWALPQAVMWERLRLELVVARYVRDVLAVENGDVKGMASSANMRAEVRQLEDRLGLNPSAMNRLHWEIAEVESTAPAPTPRPRRLRAVDPSAAS